MKTKFELKVEKKLEKLSEEKDLDEKDLDKCVSLINKEHILRAKSKAVYVALPVAGLEYRHYAFGPGMYYYWEIGRPEKTLDYRGSSANIKPTPTRKILGGNDPKGNPFIFDSEFEALVFVEMLNSAACNVRKKISLEP
jgi:hypothetical protein